MKRLSLIIAALISLTSCGSGLTSTRVSAKGEVVSCKQIAQKQSSSGKLTLTCLDGGSEVNIKAITGPALINVWGSWCEPCTEEMPYLVEFKRAHPAIAIIGVDVEENTPADGKKFVLEHGMTWPNLYDGKASTRKYFGMGVPVTWFVGRDGTILFKQIGPFASAREIESLTEKYFGVQG